MKLLLFVPLLLSLTAAADVEVRAHYGSLQTKPNAFNAQMETFVKNAPDLDGPSGFGADALLVPSAWPAVVGLRYETFGYSKSGAGTISSTAVNTSTKLDGSRTSALVGYRFRSLKKAYGGLLAHVALAQKLKYTMSSVNGGGSTHVDAFDFKMLPSFGLALEGGSRFGWLTLGGEIGYTVFKAKNASDSIGVILDSNMKPVRVDLSGPYFKLLIGARF